MHRQRKSAGGGQQTCPDGWVLTGKAKGTRVHLNTEDGGGAAEGLMTPKCGLLRPHSLRLLLPRLCPLEVAEASFGLNSEFLSR